MARNPQVLATSPRNYETDVVVNTSISAEFSIDLDQRYLANNVYLRNNAGETIEGRTSFRKQKLTFTPLEPLRPATTYTLTLLGDSNLDNEKVEGIRNIMGEPLMGNFTLTFVTEADDALTAPIGKLPQQDVVINQTPTFYWSVVEGADAYELQLSHSNRFDTLVYPLEENHRLTETEVNPNIVWEDGIHYWRIRSVKEDGSTSEWSSIYQFNLNRVQEGTIADDDVVESDIFYEENDLELEMIEQFPKHLTVDVPLTVQSIYFRVLGTIDRSILDDYTFKLHGTHITGDEYEESHGDVKGFTSVVSDTDGTVYLIFTPDVLSEEMDGDE